MADSDRVLDSVYGLEIVAPAAYVTGAAGVPRLDLVAALAAAAGGGGGAAVTIVETAANFSAEVGTHYEVNTSGAGVTNVDCVLDGATVSRTVSSGGAYTAGQTIRITTTSANTAATFGTVSLGATRA